MTSPAESRPTSSSSRLSATVCAVLAILIASAGLTSCRTVSYEPKASTLPSLVQPPVLRLKAGVQVQTVDGPYTPPADEVWHSDARFRHAEQQATDAAAALAQLQNRTR